MPRPWGPRSPWQVSHLSAMPQTPLRTSLETQVATRSSQLLVSGTGPSVRGWEQGGTGCGCHGPTGWKQGPYGSLCLVSPLPSACLSPAGLLGVSLTAVTVLVLFQLRAQRSQRPLGLLVAVKDSLMLSERKRSVL